MCDLWLSVGLSTSCCSFFTSGRVAETESTQVDSEEAPPAAELREPTLTDASVTMKKGHRSSWKRAHHLEDDSEEWAASDGCWGRDKAGEARDVMTEEDDEGVAESCTPTYSQVLQGWSNKTKKLLTCPPVIVSDKHHHRFPWEDKPVLVMKITKRRRCKPNRDPPRDGSAPRLSSREKEVPADRGLTSEDGATKTPWSWTHGDNLREEDASEAAETKRSTEKEEEPNNIWTSKVQPPKEQTGMDVKGHEDSGTCDQLVDENQEVQEYRQRPIHQLDEGQKDKVINVQQETEDEQQLSHSDDASQDEVQQPEEHPDTRKTKVTIREMLVILLEDKKTQGTEQKQSFITKHEHLLQQIENITDKEEKMEMQLQQLQKRERQLEDICGGLEKRKKRFPSIFFSKASKMEKKTIAETDVTVGKGKKKRSKWFPLIFFSKASSVEKEATAETEMTEGEV